MNYCKVIIFSVILCLLMVQCFSAIPFRHKRVIKLCGSRLVDAVALACGNHYNSPRNKKSVNFNQEYLDDTSVPDYSEDYNQNALSSSSLFERLFDAENPYIPMRQQRGIVDECCKKPCHLDVLRAYCD